MKKSLLCAILISIFSIQAHAGEAKMAWGDLSKFTDIQEGQELKSSFEERLVKEIGDVFNRFSGKYLPDGYILEVTVTDMDLAGDIRPMMVRGGNMRLVTHIYWPKMSFDYVLKNAQNETVKAEKVSLADMNFMGRASIPSGRTIFEYEEKMIDDWFRKQQNDKVFPKRDEKS